MKKEYQQELKYLDNWEDLANEFINNADLYKYPSELEVGYEGVELKKGDTVRLIDKGLDINALYKVISVKKDGTCKLKLKKIGESE